MSSLNLLAKKEPSIFASAQFIYGAVVFYLISLFIIRGELKGANGSILDLGKNLKGFIKKSKGLSVGENLIVQCVNTVNEDKLPLFSKDILIKEKHVIFNPSGKGVSLSKKLRGNDRLKALKELNLEIGRASCRERV